MESATEGIRDRRRRETTKEIELATLDLLETRGWEATTVAEISALVGISSRTFFRYFDSKELAAMPSQRRLWDACESFAVEQPTFANVTLGVKDMLHHAMLGDVIADTAPGDGRQGAPRELTPAERAAEVAQHRRLARLFQIDPQLYVIAGARDAEFVQALYQRCTLLLPEHPRAELRALSEMAMLLWRTAWWHWGVELSGAPDASPQDSFAAALETLGSVFPVVSRVGAARA